MLLSTTGKQTERHAATSAKCIAIWCITGSVLVACGFAAGWWSDAFGYDHEVLDIPARGLAAALCVAGIAYAVSVPWLVRRTADRDRRTALAIMILAGLAARLVLIPSEPMLEDDYQRYLWDGAVTAAGLNPYAVSPKGAEHAPLGSRLRQIATESGPVRERIGHGHLRTIYPPVAQAAFAMAHLLNPWSVVAWKAVLLVFDLAVLCLILILLAQINREPLWAALYWWNPLVMKETFNSAHMEPIVMAPVLLALVLSVRGRTLASVAALGVAAGAKVWPVLLLPLLLRPLLSNPRHLAVALSVFGGLCALWLWPVVAGGLDDNSGFVAYAGRWQTNSALFPALEKLATAAVTTFGATPEWGNRVARAVVALTACAIALWVARRPAGDSSVLVTRAGVVAAALVMLSPAQYPWYAIWFLPFLPFLQLRTFLVLTATLPLYYAFFHYNARGYVEVFSNVVVWLIWIPAWIALAADLRDASRPSRALAQ